MKKNYKLKRTQKLASLKAGKLCRALFLLAGISTASFQAQTTYSFTNASATGSAGPTQAQINSAYLATNLNGSVGIVTQGIQQFTVPATGSYSITAWGAGGPNAFGAKLNGTFNFSAGQVLYIAVGQSANPSGGNGGSFVSTGTSIATSTALIVAGGGGGNSSGAFKSVNNYATYNTIGNPGTTGLGGAALLGGQTNTNNTQYGGGGGGGFTGNGVNTSSYGIVGSSFINGALGGPIGINNANTVGGFGGGGAGYPNDEPAGGGGYSGGGGGGYEGLSNTGQGSNRFGGGGGSYNSGIIQATLGITNVGNGSVLLFLNCASPSAPTNTTQIANQNICPNNTTTLNATGTGTLNWYSSPTSTIVIGTGTNFITPTLSVGSYTYYAAATNSCSEGPRTPITLTVNPLPIVAIVGGTAAVCAGSAINLTASGANTYSWSNGAVTTTIAPTPTVNASYTVVGTSTAGCTNSAVKAVTVTAAPSVSVAGASTICIGQNATLTASGANTYSWNTGSALAGIVVNPTITTNYTVNGTSTVTGCSASTTANLIVSPCTGLSSLSAKINGLSVYPNPSNGEFTVELNNGLYKTIQVTDLTGRVVLTNASSKDKVNVNMANLANGIYYVKIQSDNAVEVIKVVKQ